MEGMDNMVLDTELGMDNRIQILVKAMPLTPNHLKTPEKMDDQTQIHRTDDDDTSYFLL